MVRVVITFILLSLSIRTYAQYLPAEDSRLNYRIVGFSFPRSSSTTDYEVEIAKGQINSEEDFVNNVVTKAAGTTNRLTAEVLEFGATYTWRFITTDGSGIKTKSEFHHFSTVAAKWIDSTLWHLKVSKNMGVYRDAFIFSDRSRVLFDMNGNPVWYLPNIKGAVEDISVVRDMKQTSFGTITFIANDVGYEINYDAKILWRTPPNNIVTNDTSEITHHEFTRLSNGHYMALGNETTYWEKRAMTGGDSSLYLLPGITPQLAKPGKKYVKMPFGTVIEYDQKGKVVWRWKSSDRYRMLAQEGFAPVRATFDIHENAFYFNEKTEKLYVSFKNISSVFKISYPDGKILNEYGSVNDANYPNTSIKLFCDQHSCKQTEDGYLYLFNNNACNANSLPKIVMMQEPKTPTEQLQVIWEYQYPITASGIKWSPLTSGGNVIELGNKSFFVSLCTPYANVFIVNKDKQLLWEGTFECYDLNEKKWRPLELYRASIIKTKKDLEHLIWAKRS